MRPTHYLRRSKHVGFPRRQIVVSVSWDRVPRDGGAGIADDTLLSWGACEWSGPPGHERWESQSEGLDAESFWRWLRSRMKRRVSTWVWFMGAAHALTLLQFWSKLTRGEWLISGTDCNAYGQESIEERCEGQGLCIIEDPPTIILSRPAHASGSCRFLDARNLGVDSWASAQIAEGDYRALAVWLQAWSRVVDDLRLGGLRQTAASQSYHGWRHSYLDEGVLVHGDDSALLLERDGVYPGRAECYRLGQVQGDTSIIDASAHYPSCAAAGGLPVRLRWHGRCDNRDAIAAAERGWCVIARCRVRCRQPMVPCRRAGIVVWPVGAWECVLCGPELIAAESAGYLSSVSECAIYEPGDPLGRYMRTLWDARKTFSAAGRTAEQLCVKLLANSCIGKLAARKRSWIDAPESLPPGDWRTWHRIMGEDRKLVRHRTIGWHAQRLEIDGETEDSTPALAAWIYSEGRMRLWNWMRTAGSEEVYYVDSDSVFCSGVGASRLQVSGAIQPGKMGALRVQGVHQGVRISGIRDYRCGDKVVRAGVPSPGTSHQGTVYAWWRDSTVRESIDEWTEPRAEARLVVIPEARIYRHGTVCADGRVEPLVVEE
jgi:DNA polymerase type B, organellar and viral